MKKLSQVSLKRNTTPKTRNHETLHEEAKRRFNAIFSRPEGEKPDDLEVIILDEQIKKIYEGKFLDPLGCAASQIEALYFLIKENPRCRELVEAMRQFVIAEAMLSMMVSRSQKQ